MVEQRRVIMLYDVEERHELKWLSGNPSRIMDMLWHPSGEALLCLGDLGTLRVWGRERGNLLASANAGRGRPTAMGMKKNGEVPRDQALPCHDPTAC